MKQLLMLLVGGALTVGAAVLPLTPESWRGWNENQPVAVRTLSDEKGDLQLEFTIPAGSWNAPVHHLAQPYRLTAHTMLRFQVFTPHSGDWELTLFVKPGAEYSVTFPSIGGEWVTVQKYLGQALYKRGSTVDTLLGAELNGFQLAIGGGNSPVRIAGVELFEGGEEMELPVDITGALIEEWRREHPVAEYPLLRRNGIFPFGVVARMDANSCAASLFGRELEESLTFDLMDMKQHHLNTYLNFCDGTDFEARLARSEVVGLRLIETMFCGTRFAALADEAPEWEAFERGRRSPALLAWYGPDEPAPSSAPSYLADKAVVMERDGEHPYTSAFHLGAMRQLLGGAMEVMVPDCYSLYPGQDPTNSAPVLSHYTLARDIRAQTGGKRVWFMTQTFSNRHGKSFSARYPTPEEIRLDMYASVAGGASGMLFFIYNDLPTYLDGRVRGEEFDYTLVDPWGNGNAVYDEIAEFGRKVVPVMPSFLDAEPSDTIAIKADERLLVGQLANAMGTLLIPVNTSLTEAYQGQLQLTLPEGTRLFDLETLTPSEGMLSLAPGSGSLLAIATPEQFRQLQAEITGRRQQQQSELAELRHRQVAAAGFSGEASAEWLQAEQQLQEIQAAFGAIHRQLIPPEAIVRADGGTEFAPLHQRLIALSREYFALKQEWATGTIPAMATMTKLREELTQLKLDYQSTLRQP